MNANSFASNDEEDLARLEEMRKNLLDQLRQEEQTDDENQSNENCQNKGQTGELDEHLSDSNENDELADELEQHIPSSYSSSIKTSDDESSDEEASMDYASEFKCDEIDSMLEQSMEQPGGEGTGPNHISKKFKRVLEFRGMDHFDVLPDGWVEITHASGLPVFLHRPSRCCTFSRPYFIGRGSVRNHSVPESAIPCLFQRKIRSEFEKTEQQKNNQEAKVEGDANILCKLSAPSVKVKTEVDLHNSQLNADQLYEYAKNCFKFKNICVLRFRKWSEARNFYKQKKARRTLNQTTQNGGSTREARPSLPSSVKLITVPALEADSKPHQRTFYLNPQGKTSVSILHEFVQKVLKCTVRYFFNETRSSATPFHCVAKLVSSGTPTAAGPSSSSFDQLTSDLVRQKLAFIQRQNEQKKQLDEGSDRNQLQLNDNGSNDQLIAIGEGFGAGKKNAKLIAAKNALLKLVPGIDFDEEGIAVVSSRGNENTQLNKEKCEENAMASEDPLHIFDLLSITDTRIPELSARAGQPSPYLILQEYLKRCSTYGNTAIQLTTRRLRHQRHEFALSVGGNNSERVRVVSTNKREGKQKAAQAMLKKLHPNNSTWGSLLRLYGYEAQMKLKEARKCKDSVTKLQGISDEKCQEGKATGEFQPNTIILKKLQSEMLKLSEGIISQQKDRKKMPNCQQTIERLLEKEESGEPTAKLRRSDFHSELPILTEEQLRQLSSKLAIKYPNDEELVHIPSLKS
ncbi:hypothetical protein niasHS_014932 [Heterodera schachtii]|uniref:DRBM domain-containing protein n=1 Tax=Heterodera schachtii TaxID=97005 RepID=A0ABD2IL71_HETSC